ncbi:4a-hydroxytetrahydrobiopterin dehydratase [Chelatococcus composti]|jgi:4a-hydroxytetrahydrobiopterin dehydratase|uniref:Putative pterin-4-alpha-carbinolamine dehydratase n=1 Tax=Chelatococcus composti TaxID=1743235 RepID=A0A841KH20_9HYPH|nr:4a-hydroxytetrahydrobiopterin dehydratase [Chelatococcus composti]MBB6169206.1 4a-hydroxytetrahydrobiopterin dehydratase [Chelatococcus composti]MBS7735914.1 4a-hydroxytetrahydrobiopterin dehydratase [Chelatococcus composti]GGG45967.1 pterin-4-alpha-carbinolamine dehydratase [Chelatococcus composti]
MTDDLAARTCTPCKGGIPPLSRDAIAPYAKQVPQWQVGEDATRITRTFRFRNYADAFAFVARVSEIAEQQGHHPDITFGWGYATVTLQTHKIKGLHENDFIMAARIDEIAGDAAAA